MHVVADTGPLLHLAEAGASHLLVFLGEILVPPSVAVELRRLCGRGVVLPAVAEISLDDGAQRAGDQWCSAGLIDRGEADAIALARQVGAGLFLTDDTAARVLAVSIGLQARGSLGVVLWLAARRHVDERGAHRLLEALEGTSLWLSPRVKAEARQALRSVFSSGS
jgi:predicted nucleic acid-binding protein